MMRTSEFQDKPPPARIQYAKSESELLVPGEELVDLWINGQKGAAGIGAGLSRDLDRRCDEIGTKALALKTR